MKENSAKSRCLEVANENPAEVLIVSVINGQVKVAAYFNTPGAACFMLEVLKIEILKLILKPICPDLPGPQS